MDDRTTALRRRQLEQNWRTVNERLAKSLEKSGRLADEVRLIAVSKTQSVTDMASLASLGAIHFGENRVSELCAKRASAELANLDIVYHMIGTLQRRKVKEIIGTADLIHSVDTLELAREISKRSVAADVDTPILLELNVSGEATKHGFDEGGFRRAWTELLSLDRIAICGLMTMAPFSTNPEDSRDVFWRLRDLFAWTEAQAGTPVTFTQLSMGMSGDFEVAIECGATMVRVGTALFAR